jgi:hypothetical protein
MALGSSWRDSNTALSGAIPDLPPHPHPPRAHTPRPRPPSAPIGPRESLAPTLDPPGAHASRARLRRIAEAAVGRRAQRRGGTLAATCTRRDALGDGMRCATRRALPRGEEDDLGDVLGEGSAVRVALALGRAHVHRRPLCTHAWAPRKGSDPTPGARDGELWAISNEKMAELEISECHAE